MSRLPFNLRDRKRLSTQSGYGFRPRNNWGSGDLPAPFAEGDIVERVSDVADDRLRDQAGPFFVVSCAFSIDEGDEWYFRVRDGSTPWGSDRLHVLPTADYMAAFSLVDTSDPDGLALREMMLAEGWVDTEKTP